MDFCIYEFMYSASRLVRPLFNIFGCAIIDTPTLFFLILMQVAVGNTRKIQAQDSPRHSLIELKTKTPFVCDVTVSFD